MTVQELMTESAKLRLRFHMNGRLRLESLAALSKVFRENQEPIQDELLASLVLALPQELVGESELEPYQASRGAKSKVHTPKNPQLYVPKHPPLNVPKHPPLNVPKHPPLNVPKHPPSGRAKSVTTMKPTLVRKSAVNASARRHNGKRKTA